MEIYIIILQYNIVEKVGFRENCVSVGYFLKIQFVKNTIYRFLLVKNLLGSIHALTL